MNSRITVSIAFALIAAAACVSVAKPAFKNLAARNLACQKGAARVQECAGSSSATLNSRNVGDLSMIRLDDGRLLLNYLHNRPGAVGTISHNTKNVDLLDASQLIRSQKSRLRRMFCDLAKYVYANTR